MIGEGGGLLKRFLVFKKLGLTEWVEIARNIKFHILIIRD